MLRCQLRRFDQKRACLSLSHQFPMKVFGLQHTPAMNVAQRAPSYPPVHNTPIWHTPKKKKEEIFLCSP